MHGKCSCAKFVGCFHSSDTYLKDANLRDYLVLTEHPWTVVYFSFPQQQQQHHTHGCQISTIICQLNRARVAHDARPALSSYQNKCCISQAITYHNSNICNLWSLTVLIICYTTIPRTGICGVDNDVGQSVMSWAVPALVRPIRRFMCVTVWTNFSLYNTLVHSTFCVKVKFVLIVPML